jgi:hypothetical protein
MKNLIASSLPIRFKDNECIKRLRDSNPFDVRIIYKWNIITLGPSMLLFMLLSMPSTDIGSYAIAENKHFRAFVFPSAVKRKRR